MFIFISQITAKVLFYFSIMLNIHFLVLLISTWTQLRKAAENPEKLCFHFKNILKLAHLHKRKIYTLNPKIKLG